MANKYKVIDDADYLVDLKKLEAFYDKIKDMARVEFGVDADGDSLVEVDVGDRTRYERSHYFQIPYNHKAKTEEERDRIIGYLASNLSMASDAIKTALDIASHRNRVKRDDQKVKAGMGHLDARGYFCDKKDCACQARKEQEKKRAQG